MKRIITLTALLSFALQPMHVMCGPGRKPSHVFNGKSGDEENTTPPGGISKNLPKDKVAKTKAKTKQEFVVRIIEPTPASAAKKTQPSFSPAMFTERKDVSTMPNTILGYLKATNPEENKPRKS